MLDPGHRLLPYVDKETLDVEWVWNNRDGRVPDFINAPGGELQLRPTGWRPDLGYRPKPGSRMFVDWIFNELLQAEERIVYREWSTDFCFKARYPGRVPRSVAFELAKGLWARWGGHVPRLVVVGDEQNKNGNGPA